MEDFLKSFNDLSKHLENFNKLQESFNSQVKNMKKDMSKEERTYFNKISKLAQEYQREGNFEGLSNLLKQVQEKESKMNGKK